MPNLKTAEQILERVRMIDQIQQNWMSVSKEEECSYKLAKHASFILQDLETFITGGEDE